MNTVIRNLEVERKTLGNIIRINAGTIIAEKAMGVQRNVNIRLVKAIREERELQNLPTITPITIGCQPADIRAIRK